MSPKGPPAKATAASSSKSPAPESAPVKSSVVRTAVSPVSSAPVALGMEPASKRRKISETDREVVEANTPSEKLAVDAGITGFTSAALSTLSESFESPAESSKDKEDELEGTIQTDTMIQFTSTMFNKFLASSIELQKCVIFDKEGSDSAIAFLLKQEVIAADCEWVTDDANVRRLSLVQVATAHRESHKQRCYLFDTLIAGGEIFDWGLRQVLESPTIVKIFHDCRWDSRVLAQFNCRLENVFDTQVAYCVFSRQTTLNTPFPVSLNTLLGKYAFGEKNRYKDVAKAEMEADKQYWIRRPLSEIQIRYARDDVLKLPVVYRQLKAGLHVQNVKLIEAHSAAYVAQLRDMKDEAEVEARYAPPADGSRPRPKYGIPSLDDDVTRSLERRSLRETARMSRNVDATANYFPLPSAATSKVPSFYTKKLTSVALPKPPPLAPREPKPK